MLEYKVPNAPCGVESSKMHKSIVGQGFFVPNAPCGVERRFFYLLLKHRYVVPNAPCGVERLTGRSVWVG